MTSNIGLTEILLLVLLPLALLMGGSVFFLIFMMMKGRRSAPQPSASREPRCSFCGSQEQGDSRLIAGQGAFICEACVARFQRLTETRSGEQPQ
jgi:hypothetical protein